MTTHILKTQLQFHCSLLMGEQKNREFYSLLFYNTELLIFLHAFKHNFLAKKTMQYHIEHYISFLTTFMKYKMFQMIIRKFTVAIILLNLSEYFSKNHGFGYRSLAHQDGNKSKAKICDYCFKIPFSSRKCQLLPPRIQISTIV